MSFPINPITPFYAALPEAAFDNLIKWAGINVYWKKNHNCPCVGDTGSPNPSCTACLGRGWYWEDPQGPFIVLMTLVTWIGRNVDMGEQTDPNYGMVFQGHPIITIPATLQPIWAEATTNDLFIEYDNIQRFQATLRVGQQQTIPAWHILGGSLTIAPSGAVVVEDPTINQPVSGIAYTVSGGTVTLNPNSQYPAGYPDGTAYTVDYTSSTIFVINEPYGGLAHVRPFGQGITYPRRWKMSLLDMWLRSTVGSNTGVGKGP